jgi:RNA polymerase sigma-70 factor (ECF subfamily)
VAASAGEIERLYRERYVGFRNGVATVTGSFESARDVVQEAFAVALARREQFRGEGPLAAWVWRIALRLALERRGDPAAASLDRLRDAAIPQPERDPELAAALEALPARRRLIVFLYYYADLSYREIAAVTGLSEGTVAATLSQARDALRISLVEHPCGGGL